ncbi:MAG: FAD-dependent monooxygenase [Betaproteobacteria bacterium]|nr:FAD-dependent monooxygenase [Betaproteobacteria bacterium]
MVTALALAQRGMHVTVLEAEATYDEKPRAATTHASTLDMLDGLGIGEEVVRQGLISRRFQHWDRVSGKLIAEFDFSVLGGETNHPYAVQCESHKTVNICAQSLTAFPDATLLHRHEVVGVGRDADHVWADCDTPHGKQRFTGDYLVGTDGARSIVRRLCDIDFAGYTFAERFVGLTTPFDFEAKFGYSNRNYFADPERFVLLFKVSGNDFKGLWRVISKDGMDEPDDVVLSEAKLQERLQYFWPNDTRYDIHYRGLYKFHQRVAAQFSKGRMFLAGDAAHVNNPMGGLGMNSGIHDGMELALLFDLIQSGKADAAILARYDRRRRPLNVEYVQQVTVANKHRLEEKDPVIRRERLDELGKIVADPVQHKAFLMRASLIDSVRKAGTID